MLVQNSIYRNTYLTDGVNKDFYFSFPILEASQVLVQTSGLTDTDTVTTVDPSQYTVTGVGLTTGGYISFNTAPPTGSRLALTLNIPITQLYQYAELDSFPAKSHEDALAKLTLICQQLREQISRAVLISATSEGSTADFIASLYAARDSAAASAESAVAEAAAATLAAASALTAAATFTPATTTSRGIGRVATSDDMVDGATINNGPAFLAAGTDASWINQPSIRGVSSNLKCSSTGTNANVTCTIDEIVVKNSNNKYLTLRGVSASASVTNSGAGGLDINSVAANTWYYVHVIYNPATPATALLLSLSATASTLPSGYTYWALVGAVYTDATNKYPLAFNQTDKRIDWVPTAGTNLTAARVMASGAAGAPMTPTLVSVAVSAFVPPIAKRINVLAAQSIATNIMASPYQAVGAWGSITNPPPIQLGNTGNGACGNASAVFPLISSNVYWACGSANGSLVCLGWEM